MQRAPWWVWSLYMGGLFGLFRFGWSYLVDGRSLALALLSGAIGAIFFGLILGPLTARMARRQRAAMGPLPDEDARVARRAAMRGPLPPDPQLRQAAAGVAAFQLDQWHRQRYWGPALWVALVALGVWLTVSDSPWWGVSVALFSGFLLAQLWMPRHLRRRLALLQQQDPATTTVQADDRGTRGRY
jgi:hypothetical protein